MLDFPLCCCSLCLPLVSACIQWCELSCLVFLSCFIPSCLCLPQPIMSALSLMFPHSLSFASPLPYRVSRFIVKVPCFYVWSSFPVSLWLVMSAVFLVSSHPCYTSVYLGQRLPQSCVASSLMAVFPCVPLCVCSLYFPQSSFVLYFHSANKAGF